jgi:hypothetical protein
MAKPIKRGPPSSYTQEMADEICDRLGNGESLVQICHDDHLPNRSTVMRWMAEIPEFATRCARAREFQADYEHDDMQRIEARVLDGEIPADVARVVLSSKQWRASKLAPKKYGDKLQQEITGADGGALKFVVEVPSESADLADWSKSNA